MGVPQGTPHLDLARYHHADLAKGFPFPSGPGWGYPIPGWGVPQGTPIWTWPGYPHADLARGYPLPSGPGWGTPVGLDLAGVPPNLDLAEGPHPWPGGITGYPPPPSGHGQGTLPHLDLAGVGPPPPQVWTDKQSENITSRLVLRTRSVKMVNFDAGAETNGQCERPIKQSFVVKVSRNLR